MQTPRTILVIGNGMVSHRFCASLREAGATRNDRVVVVGEEPRPAYDRVHLTSYFTDKSADELLLADTDWYRDNGIELRLGRQVARLQPAEKRATLNDGSTIDYDEAVLATGSAPFVPPVPGTDKAGVFVYRTIEDLDAIKAYGGRSRRAAVIGGGLLGLAAARAVQEAGLQTHVVEMAPRLMPRQLDDAAAALLQKSIEALGVEVHLGVLTQSIEGDAAVSGIRFQDDSLLEVDMVVISAGIRPRDELARDAGIEVGPRGGIVVDDQLATSAPHVHAVGEVALHRGVIYGLVAPCYEMADVLAKTLAGESAGFNGGDLSAKLKLLGVDVASFGDPFVNSEPTKDIVFQDLVQGVYKKLVLSDDASRVLGGILVGDTSKYVQLMLLCRSGAAIEGAPEALILGSRDEAGPAPLPATAQVCSCNNVTKEGLCNAIRQQQITDLNELKSCTKAGTGCGGCVPLVTDQLNAELAAMGQAVKPRLCEHFDFTRQELYEIVRVKEIRSFEELVASHGQGDGCEICKPTVASILATTRNEMILRHATLQDTNDRFLANTQRRGLYSVIPRVPGGEITPDKLIVLGEVAKKYGLYTKITGGQRIDLFGARLNDLPDIWEELVTAGFESGHAYGKAMRTVKSCVGSTWCRYGVQDSVGFSIRVEERYRGLRAPHKLKSAVSGCTRECAEAQSKDFGIIATENGWNLYVCGNGGMKPRHADLLASDLDEETCLRYIDRFLMFYIRTADKLTRTSVWLEKLEGGIDHLKDVVINDTLGIAADLESQMQYLVDTYKCEWKEVVDNPELRARFRHFANAPDHDPSVRLVEERTQHRPADWDKQPRALPKLHLPVVERTWVDVAAVNDVPAAGGIAVKYGNVPLALFNLSPRGAW